MRRYGSSMINPCYDEYPDLADLHDNAYKTSMNGKHGAIRNTKEKRRTRTKMKKIKRSRLKREIPELLEEHYSRYDEEWWEGDFI